MSSPTPAEMGDMSDRDKEMMGIKPASSDTGSGKDKNPETDKVMSPKERRQRSTEEMWKLPNSDRATHERRKENSNMYFGNERVERPIEEYRKILETAKLELAVSFKIENRTP